MVPLWMASADRPGNLARKVRLDLAVRSRQGAWGHPACMLLAFATSRLANRTPAVMWSAFGVLAILSLLRLILLRRMALPDASGPRHWHVRHSILVLSCAAIWGIVPAYATYVFGRYDQDTMIIYLYHAAIAVGTITLLVHDL